MKNKLFLKAEPDTNPDMVSPHPPAGSHTRSECTHTNLHSTPNRDPMFPRQAEVFQLEEVAVLS